MKQLWVQLTLAFSLITGVGVAAVALLTNRQVGADFRSYVAQSQLQSSPVIAELAGYYAEHGGWQGVEQLLGGVGGARRGMAGRGGPSFTLANSSGQIVYDEQPERIGARLASADQAAATPIEVAGQPAGYLLVRAGAGGALTQAGQQFLAQVNRALLQAGLLAGALGLLLGLLIARGIAAPLSRLAFAARQVARGQLGQRVPVGGAAEVAAAAQAFNEMAGSLQQAERLRQNMIADIAHELRTPLTVIQGNLRAILDDVYPLEKAEITTIYDETLMLSRLVGDLRELAQAEAGQLTLAVRPTEVAPLLVGALAPFEAPAAAQGVTLRVEPAAALPAVQADADRIRQVLHNLLANALRHTPPGGAITLAAARDPGAAPGVLFSVTDTGQGIAAADLPHVFERFWRADRARTRDQGGSGLGLAIARQLIEAHGGQIGAASEPGVGSRFWFRLLAAPGPHG